MYTQLCTGPHSIHPTRIVARPLCIVQTQLDSSRRIQLKPGIKKLLLKETVRAFFEISDKKRCLLTHTEAKKRAIFSGLRSKKGEILEKIARCARHEGH